MVKAWIGFVVTICFVLKIGPVKAQQIELDQPDQKAIELLIATQWINHFSDSLNLISRPQQLPAVLSDYLLDWKITKGVCSYVTPANFSFRKSIIDRVVREDVLQWIIESKNPAYDLLYDPVKVREQHSIRSTTIYHGENIGYCELPYMKMSTRQLAMFRLSILRANKQQIDH